MNCEICGDGFKQTSTKKSKDGMCVCDECVVAIDTAVAAKKKGIKEGKFTAKKECKVKIYEKIGTPVINNYAIDRIKID